ncbi:hypothetical protein [Nostoc sp. CHAB 5715]|uniref:hypothetical protein n=1 Tax=Nostoc sp. CHAB 5715 TaxID=2780400 RepID=UPI001E5362F9|nr:hypothetical protein [Nostoc sp. CHAB 5715]MCC5622325.1 hypothetical protein [Nostoc sp. CHAB 5715]
MIRSLTIALHRNVLRWLVELQRLSASGERERYADYEAVVGTAAKIHLPKFEIKVT